MISRGPLAYNAEETCRPLSMMMLDAIGNIGNRSDSQIIGRIENQGYYAIRGLIKSERSAIKT